MTDDIIWRLGEIAGSAGTTLATAMATDLWGTVRDGLAGLLGGGDRRQEAGHRDQLEESRRRLQGSTTTIDAVSEEWSTRLHQVLIHDPALALPMAALLDDLVGQLPTPVRPAVVQTARADRGGVVNQAGRDVVHLPPRGGR